MIIHSQTGEPLTQRRPLSKTRMIDLPVDLVKVEVDRVEN